MGYVMYSFYAPASPYRQRASRRNSRANTQPFSRLLHFGPFGTTARLALCSLRGAGAASKFDTITIWRSAVWGGIIRQSASLNVSTGTDLKDCCEHDLQHKRRPRNGLKENVIFSTG